MNEPVIDLGRLADSNHRYDLSVSNESPEDAQARRMRLMLFSFALVFVSMVFCGCVYRFAQGSPDDKKWAGGIVASVTSGLIGYLVGGTKKKASAPYRRGIGMPRGFLCVDARPSCGAA